MKHAILTINAGSSSIKFALFADDDVIPPKPEMVGQIDGIGAKPHLKAKDKQGRVLDDSDLDLPGAPETQHRAALAFLVRWLQDHEGGWEIIGVGHRVVHGAQDYSQPIRLDDATVSRLKAFIPLAPLHQPHNIAGIEAMREALPGIPQVACFDTAFHRSQPPLAQLFALPRRITAQGVRRYGFHGLSYEYIADVLPQHLGDRADGRVIVAHLGNGASMCAMINRRSQASTMGFTAVEGLMMGTRTGSLDPGVVLYLMDQRGMDARAIEKLLYGQSGLLGVSGVSSDMRTLLDSGEPRAALAVDLYCYRIRRELGSLAAALGGVDALVFTAGIGENSAAIRARVLDDAAWLSVERDAAANDAGGPLLTTAASKVAAFAIPTDEELMIAMHTRDVIRSG